MSRSVCLPALAALMMTASATSVAAQSNRSEAAEAAKTRLASRLPADTAATTGLAGSSIQFRAESDSSEAAVVLGGVEEVGWLDAWAVRFATPIQKRETSGNFITDDGLSGSSSVRVTLTHVSQMPKFATSVEERRDLALRAIEACEARAELAVAKEACTKLTFTELGVYLSAAERARLLDSAFELANIWLWTAALEVGHQEIAWRDAFSLAEHETQRTPYAFSVSVGRSFGRDREHHRQPFYLGAGVELSREYPAGDSRTLCAPPHATGPQECFTGRFGAPEPRDSQVLHVVGRFQEMAGTPFAVEIKPAYDFNNDIAELAATLYFVPDSSGGLRGGLRARWRTEDDDPMTDDDRFTFGVFVGAPFSLGFQ